MDFIADTTSIRCSARSHTRRKPHHRRHSLRDAEDGTLGLREIKPAGGVALVQNPEAMFPDMPKSAITYDGPVDFGSVQDLADEICRRTSHTPGATASRSAHLR
jgi:hypothetical protein